MKYPYKLIVGLSAIAALGMSGPASAHAKLVSSNPKANAVIRAAPAAITLRFNEAVVAAFTTVELTMPDHGGMVVPVKVSVAKGGKTVTGVPSAKLGKGAYHLVWSAAGADGHKMTGHINFKIG